MSFGHIFAGLLLKLKPKKLSIMPFGLAVTFESYEYKKLIETKKIIIAFAGPLTNILISIGLLFIHMDQDLKQIMIYSNILVALFNLIPIYPLDGGRILKGLIRKKYDDNIKSDILVNKISNILVISLTAISSILILYLKNISILFVIIYCLIGDENSQKIVCDENVPELRFPEYEEEWNPRDRTRCGQSRHRQDDRLPEP